MTSIALGLFLLGQNIATGHPPIPKEAALTPQDSHAFGGFYVEARITAIGVGRDGDLFFGTDSGLIGWITFPTDLDDAWSDSLYVTSAARFSRYVSKIAVSPDGNRFTADQAFGELGAPVYVFTYDILEDVFFSADGSGGMYFSLDSSAVFLPAREGREFGYPTQYRKWSIEFGTASFYPMFLGDGRLTDVGVGAFGKVGDVFLRVTGPAGDGTFAIDRLVFAADSAKSRFGVWSRDSALAGVENDTLHSWSGVRVACRSPDKLRINVYSILDGSLVRSIEHPTDIWYQEFYLASEDILFAATSRGEEVWDISTGEHLLTIRIVSDGRGPSLYAILPDGRYSGYEPNLDTPNARAKMVFPDFEGTLRNDAKAVNAVAFSIWPRLSSDRINGKYYLPWNPVRNRYQ